MKAFVMDEKRELVVKEMPKPQLEEDNMIVQIKTASICGTDMRTFLKGSNKITPPRILGHEFSAEVSEVSPYAKELGFKVGDRITAAPVVNAGPARQVIRICVTICKRSAFNTKGPSLNT